MKITLHTRAGYSLIEMLVYISVLAVLMTVGYAAVYRAMDNSSALRRSSEDIINTIHAGDNWRRDVRTAITKNIRVESNATEQLLYLDKPKARIVYRFSEQTVSRRVGNGGWSPVVANVKSSTFISDPRAGIRAWRWELELQPRKKKLDSLRPLFTFIAVPTNAISQ